MKRSTLMGVLLAMCVTVPGAAWSGTSVGINVNIGAAPPPPVVVFRSEPRMVIVPNSTVYVVEQDMGYDVFRYGVYWYVINDGHWYRARTYRGPFRAVHARYVPTAIVNVPPRWWRHHPRGGPPGQMKKHGDVVMVKEKGKGKHNRH